MVRHPTLAMTVLVLALALPAAAQYSGTWNITTTANLPGMGGVCQFAGQATLQQDGVSISGTVVQKLVSGPAACPPMMTAMLTGTEDEEGCVDGSLTGPLGTLYFSICPGKDPNAVSGEFGTETGPFAGASGTLMAILVEPIPTLSVVGLTALAILILAIGGWLLRRRAVV